MQKKYLTLALSAILATALTGCGGGSDNSTSTGPVDPVNPGTPEVKPGTGTPEVKPGTETGTPEVKPGTETPGTETPPTGGNDNNTTTTEPENNLDQISQGGDLNKQKSTGTQVYVRGTTSQFNTKLDPKNDKERGNSLVTNFDQLVNTQMANIVIARNTPLRQEDTTAFYIGTLVNDRNNANALQVLNNRNVDLTAGIHDSAKNNGLLSVNGTLPDSDADHIVGNEEDQETNSRIFGANYLPGNDDVAYKSNSWAYPAFKDPSKNTSATDAATLATVSTTDAKKLHNINLGSLEYGRVTADLDTLDSLDTTQNVTVINGQRYQQISTDTNSINHDLIDNVQRKSTDAVNVYFYRGNNRTDTLPRSGTYEYFGHALTYGLDNNYHGGTGGNSNAPSLNGAKDGLGNFVQATVDLGNNKVNGTVYNVWTRNDQTTAAGSTVLKDDLVNFTGSIYGPNSVVGTSELAYDTSKKGDFQASFYNSTADASKQDFKELGGSFNSIRKDMPKAPNGTGRYGDVAWGGVFGAKQVTVNADGPQSE